MKVKKVSLHGCLKLKGCIWKVNECRNKKTTAFVLFVQLFIESTQTFKANVFLVIYRKPENGNKGNEM